MAFQEQVRKYVYLTLSLALLAGFVYFTLQAYEKFE